MSAIILLPERLTRKTVATLCANGLLVQVRQKGALVDVSSVHEADSSGFALLHWLAEEYARQGQADLRLHLAKTIRVPFTTFEAALLLPKLVNSYNISKPAGWIETFGQTICKSFTNGIEALTYLGETIAALSTLAHGRFRWEDAGVAFRKSGVEALPVTLLIGFLLGLILAFQSAIPLKMFGGEGFVGGLVGLALIRELGLIITAILVAGRTGSAFAAELGTMKVNEEIDALETMGIRPVRFLALPRILAGTVSLPLLSLFATVAGLLGGWLVMCVLGFSTRYYLEQLQTFVQLKDLIGSLCKAVLFGFTLSATGCWFGLKAGRDASAVGSATTAAVVTGIVLLALLEGVLSVVFYAMGW